MEGAIDIHAHFVPVEAIEGFNSPHLLHIQRVEDTEAVLMIQGAALRAPRGLIEPQVLLRDSEERGLASRFLSTPPFLFLYELEDNQASRWAQEFNNALVAFTAQYPEKFVPVATLPMGNPVEAGQELERMASLGVRIVEIATNINGIELDDPRYRELWGLAERLGVAFFLHPYYVVGPNRMGAYHLRNLVGNPMETTLAAARLIFGGVLDTFPMLRVCLSHGGGAFPYLQGRLSHGHQVRREIQTKSPPEMYLRRFFYDSIIFSDPVLQFLIDSAGPSRVCYGTDYPFDMADPLGPAARLRRLSPETAQEIACQTPWKLLRGL